MRKKEKVGRRELNIYRDWETAWLSEIDPFPSAVLAHHYPNVPNLGDMTALSDRILSGEIEAPDLLCGGTPCQAFSVAGNRQSLDDHRGNLTLTFCEIADAIDTRRIVRGEQPAIIFWENVPGVLNTKDNAFGCFLAKLAGEDDPLEPAGQKWTNAGVVLGTKRAIAWRILDAQYFGVAQRRKRVFVVASARNGFDPAAVLFEFGGLRRDIAPSRKAGKEVTELAGTLAANGGGLNRPGCLNPACNQGGVAVHTFQPVADCLTAAYSTKWNGNSSADNGSLFVFQNIAPTLTTNDPSRSPRSTEVTNQVSAVVHAIKVRSGCDGGGKGYLGQDEQAFTLSTTQDQQLFDYKMQVRRLTPTECERLQGFPDGYTAIPYRNKPADKCPDGPRYKALGNSWAVPVVRWIGQRIIKYGA